jgi:hypothetical protein
METSKKPVFECDICGDVAPPQGEWRQWQCRCGRCLVQMTQGDIVYDPNRVDNFRGITREPSPGE